ncbi:MAG TPA: hypothetical protein VGC16_04165 [Rhizomicrobium sp.]
MSQTGNTEHIHQHSGWLIPVAVFFAILLLSGLFLGWYLRPGPRAGAAPTGKSDMVALSVKGVAFAIPANYIESARARAGGPQDSLALVALFPSLRGYSDAEARLFQGNAPDSPVIHLILRGDPNNLGARARLDRLYRPYITDPRGAAAPFELTQYGFARDSGYERNDLFAGESPAGLMLFLCERPAADLPSPNCTAIDRPLGNRLSFSYRFKRAWLGRWREMASGMDGLIRRFEKN